MDQEIDLKKSHAALISIRFGYLWLLDHSIIRENQLEFAKILVGDLMLAIKNRTELDVVRYKESRKNEGIRYNGML